MGFRFLLHEGQLICLASGVAASVLCYKAWQMQVKA